MLPNCHFVGGLGYFLGYGLRGNDNDFAPPFQGDKWQLGYLGYGKDSQLEIL